jgi:hypothetical protein
MCGGLSCGWIDLKEVDRRAQVSTLTPLNDHPATRTLLKGTVSRDGFGFEDMHGQF